MFTSTVAGITSYRGPLIGNLKQQLCAVQLSEKQTLLRWPDPYFWFVFSLARIRYSAKPRTSCPSRRLKRMPVRDSATHTITLMAEPTPAARPNRSIRLTMTRMTPD